MFDPEKLLGQMMNEALGGGLSGARRKRRQRDGFLGGLSTGSKAKLGLGVLALAYAAYEHFKQPGTAAATAPPPPPPPSAAVPPPPPRRSEHSLHMIRAMICAASADGLIDPQEREAVLARARDAGFGADDLAALEAEMSAPLTIEQLAARTPADLRDETYAAALIAVTADTEAEQRFLDRLATQLHLDDAAQQDIRQQLGL